MRDKARVILWHPSTLCVRYLRCTSLTVYVEGSQDVSFRFPSVYLLSQYCTPRDRVSLGRKRTSNECRRPMCVIVHDGVFSPAACAVLHTAACSRGLGHALFERSQPRSLIEAALDSFLEEVDDSEPFVEYWSRQEWKHIEAHADVDERRATAFPDQPLRYPTNGHVLYLDVGPLVRGPTCVWHPESASGGSAFGPLTTVPAVAGRVVRFDGSLQHAVPRPSDVWLAPFVRSQPGSSEDFLRSVVLFNTWSEAPLDVEHEEVGPKETGQEVDDARCAPRADWTAPTQRKAEPAAGAKEATMKVWLLGDETRRGRMERTLPIKVDGASVSAALEETSTVTRCEVLRSSSEHGGEAVSSSPSPSSRAAMLAAALGKL